MSLFIEIESDSAILMEGGVYKQTKLYSRNDFLFAKYGSGYIRLFSDGGTTKPTVRLDALIVEAKLFSDHHNRIKIKKSKDCKEFANFNYARIGATDG